MSATEITRQLRDERRNPFVKVERNVWDYNLTPHEGWLYTTIIYFVNGASQVAFPKLETLAEKSGMSKRHVVRCIKRLEELGLIKVYRSVSKSGKRQVNNYAVPNAEPCKPQAPHSHPIGDSQAPNQVTGGHNKNYNEFNYKELTTEEDVDTSSFSDPPAEGTEEHTATQPSNDKERPPIELQALDDNLDATTPQANPADEGVDAGESEKVEQNTPPTTPSAQPQVAAQQITLAQKVNTKGKRTGKVHIVRDGDIMCSAVLTDKYEQWQVSAEEYRAMDADVLCKTCVEAHEFEPLLLAFVRAAKLVKGEEAQEWLSTDYASIKRQFTIILQSKHLKDSKLAPMHFNWFRKWYREVRNPNEPHKLFDWHYVAMHWYEAMLWAREEHSRLMKQMSEKKKVAQAQPYQPKDRSHLAKINFGATT